MKLIRFLKLEGLQLLLSLWQTNFTGLFDERNRNKPQSADTKLIANMWPMVNPHLRAWFCILHPNFLKIFMHNFFLLSTFLPLQYHNYQYIYTITAWQISLIIFTYLLWRKWCRPPTEHPNTELSPCHRYIYTMQLIQRTSAPGLLGSSPYISPCMI